MKRGFFVAAALFFLLAGCGTSPPSATPTVELISPTGVRVAVQIEVADQPETIRRGLMERTSLAEGAGMLFIFDDDKPRTFWMKNTLIPLDILFFAVDGSFVRARTMVPCERDPCALYDSIEPARFALEVPRGFVEAHRIDRGWRMVRN
jgi:uncharacterized membrane protein (UPF0127 family)